MEITHLLKIKASPEKVFKAVSSQQGISAWWSKECSVGESEGSTSTLKFDKQGTIVTMGFKTTHLNVNKKVLWECVENANPAWLGTRISTEISETLEGSEVLFSHRNFDEKWKGQDLFEMTKQGWEHFVGSLVSFCETGEGEPG
ncbi:MAG: hypothetical protein ACJAUV_000013 [Flavobacteriales bacterium]|jgi:uncharacterized protein YndB with AHSA1/START domain